MQISTKFNIDDRVWKIENVYVYKDTPCSVCNETGKISIVCEDFVCPKCNGSKLSKRGSYKWIHNIHNGMTVGQVRVCVTGSSERCFTDPGIVEEYMCHETGIGSGTIHSAEDLFWSRDEAELECARRNSLDK